MEYKKIVSVTGLPGLYELINSKNDGAIVRSLDDKTTKFASTRLHNFSHLESIEVYTTGDNVTLAEVFMAMDKSKEALPDSKDDNAVRKYLDKVYPDLDFDRVHKSDMRKMIKWFEVLKRNNVEITLPETEEAIEEKEEEEKPAEKKASKKEK